MRDKEARDSIEEIQMDIGKLRGEINKLGENIDLLMMFLGVVKFRDPSTGVNGLGKIKDKINFP